MGRHSCRRTPWAILWLCGLVAFSGGSRRASAVTSDQIQESIKKAQAYLYSKQGKAFTWESTSEPAFNSGTNPHINFSQRQWGGLTAITVYSLLASGENPQSEKLKPAVEFLTKANLQSTYALGISSQIWLFLPETPQIKQTISHTAKMLDLGMIRKGEAAGLYTYYTGLKNGTDSPQWAASTAGYVAQPGTARPNPAQHGEPKGDPSLFWDLSNSQYAVLGMWALTEAGAEIPIEYWKRAQDAWGKWQQPDGGWKYDNAPNRKITPAMTAAGIATLFILQDFTSTDHSALCVGSSPNPAIERGLAWMDHAIDKVVSTPDYYTLYGIERIGVASGHKYFGSTDWFQKGAEYILKTQRQDGSWRSTAGDNPHRDVAADTAFALLFLSRGGAAVMMNKLQYETKSTEKNAIGGWNERPRDVANIARWAGRQIEHDLNWQVVNLKVPVEELHDAPILYIAGSQALDFEKADLDKLRMFVEQGGLILGNADCGKEAFTESFTALGKKLFPTYTFRQLPAQHPIFTREQYNAANWRSRPIVMGMSNGVRELMLLIPDSDGSRAWHTRAETTKAPLFELAGDIFQYTVDKKHLQDKGDTYIVTPDKTITATKKLKVARLMVGDNPDPEPAAWTRFAAIMHNREKIDITLINAKPGDGVLGAVKIAHMTGTGPFTLSDSARLEIKSFVQGGGTLIIDAAGGSSEFAAAAETELHTMFGNDAKQIDNPLPASNPIFSVPGFSLDNISYRAFAREALLRSARQPRIRGITFGKRIRVIYSHEDITAGLVGEPCDGIYGYEPAGCTELMRAFILYASTK